MINEKRLLDTFFDYVMIDSETKNEKAMGEKLVEDLKVLGLEVKTDKAGEGFGSNGFNVCAYLPGTIPGDPTIMCAHMDTVTPGNGIRPLVDDGIIHTSPFFSICVKKLRYARTGVFSCLQLNVS